MGGHPGDVGSNDVALLGSVEPSGIVEVPGGGKVDVVALLDGVALLGVVKPLDIVEVSGGGQVSLPRSLTRLMDPWDNSLGVTPDVNSWTWDVQISERSRLGSKISERARSGSILECSIFSLDLVETE